MPRITLTASDNFTLNAYRAEPSGKPRGGVVLYGEVWGINSWVREVADRWAAHGYLCIAPAMHDRVQFGYERDDYDFTPVKEIGKLYNPESDDGSESRVYEIDPLTNTATPRFTMDGYFAGLLPLTE